MLLSPFFRFWNRKPPVPKGQRAKARGTTSVLPPSHKDGLRGFPAEPRRCTGRTRPALLGKVPVQAAAPRGIRQGLLSPFHQTGGSLGRNPMATGPHQHIDRMIPQSISVVKPFLLRKQSKMPQGLRRTVPAAAELTVDGHITVIRKDSSVPPMSKNAAFIISSFSLPPCTAPPWTAAPRLPPASPPWSGRR